MIIVSIKEFLLVSFLVDRVDLYYDDDDDDSISLPEFLLISCIVGDQIYIMQLNS